jgi:hypothetical protein
MFDEMDKADKEVVAECSQCGDGVTSERLNEMPYDGGVPQMVICTKCEAADDEPDFEEPEPDYEDEEPDYGNEEPDFEDDLPY